MDGKAFFSTVSETSAESIALNGLLQILITQKDHSERDPESAADQKRNRRWFPCRAAKKGKLAPTVPRMPKILPFLVQRYKTSRTGVVTLPASQWCRTLQQIVLEAARRLNVIPGAGAGAGDHPNRALKEMMLFSQVEHGGPIDTFDKAAAMVIPWIAAMEPIIALR